MFKKDVMGWVSGTYVQIGKCIRSISEKMWKNVISEADFKYKIILKATVNENEMSVFTAEANSGYCDIHTYTYTWSRKSNR